MIRILTMESQKAIRLDIDTLDGYSFKNQDLGWTLFDEMELNDVDFGGARMEMANFTKAVLNGCSFAGADLRIADFSDAVLKGCDFTGANLTRTKFLRAKIENCKGLAHE